MAKPLQAANPFRSLGTRHFFLSMRTFLVTGSSGLIGSEVCVHFASLGWEIHGVDNNQRAVFFGPQGDTPIRDLSFER